MQKWRNNEQKPLVFIVFGASEAEKETGMQKWRNNEQKPLVFIVFGAGDGFEEPMWKIWVLGNPLQNDTTLWYIYICAKMHLDSDSSFQHYMVFSINFQSTKCILAHIYMYQSVVSFCKGFFNWKKMSFWHIYICTKRGFGLVFRLYDHNT